MKPENYPNLPSHLWEHFYHISQIPRPSKQEDKIKNYLTAQAETNNCPWRSDTTGNIVIYVPATAGFENKPVVIIQNHIDMVTVKTEDKLHDFDKDPLQLVVEGGWLSADRTTLGADNGIGCAAALALMSDTGVAHPPLELLFTVDEETGLGGAMSLDSSLLSGGIMLNLDTEDWGQIFIGCAGGNGWSMTRKLEGELVPANYQVFRLVLDGLTGGHSGIQIHEQLGSAIKLMVQWMKEACAIGIRISSFNSGVAHNVIPRHAELVIACPGNSIEKLELLNKRIIKQWLSYLPEVDNSLHISMEKSTADALLSKTSAQLLQQLLSVFPHGAQSYSLSQPADLVDLSINLAMVRADSKHLLLESSARFFNEAQAKPLIDNVLSLGDVFGLTVTETLNYPSWTPEFDNPLLSKVKELHKTLFGYEPQVKAIHAGLECGILKGKMGEVDIISFGPTIKGAHSPSERLEIATIEPFWKLLTSLLVSL